MKSLIALIILSLFVPAVALERGEDAVKSTTAITLPVDSITIYPDGLVSVKSMGILDVIQGARSFVVNVPSSALASSVTLSVTNSTVESVVYNANPTYILNISTSTAQKFLLSYLIYYGGSWEPRYDLHLFNKSMLISAKAVVQNKGSEDWDGVNLKLVAGMPRVTEPYMGKFALQQANYADAVPEAAMIPAPASSYATSSSSELEAFYIFQLEGRKDLEHNKAVGFSLFQDSAPIDMSYVWDASSDESGPAMEEIRVNNTMEAPWPSGSAMLYKDDDYISTITMPYTPNGTNASITIGPSTDLKVSKKIKDHNKTEALKGTVSQDGANHTLKEAIEVWTYELGIKSNVDRPAMLEVSDTRPMDSKLINVSMNASELMATGMEWKLTLSPWEKRTISYSYQVITTEPL